jgi:hypothetical protein
MNRIDHGNVPLTDDWDPPIADREYFRHSSSGDRGYKVRRGGKEMIRLDRPMQEIILPLIESTWRPDEYGSKLLPMAAAMIAYAADREILRAHGRHAEARKTWQDLKDQERQKWLAQGPGKDPGCPLRQEIYRAISKALGPHIL